MKGYYRKGKALAGLEKIEDAISTFKHGLAMDPPNKEMKQGLEEAQKRKLLV